MTHPEVGYIGLMTCFKWAVIQITILDGIFFSKTNKHLWNIDSECSAHFSSSKIEFLTEISFQIGL